MGAVVSSLRGELEFGVGYVGDEPVSQQVRRAAWLESTGRIAQVWIADERFYRDVWVQLACCATATERIRLGVCVTDPFIRHPALTASAMATLDEVSGGRGVLGIGAGVSGFDALGIERTRPATAIREAVQLIRRLWAATGPVTFEGEVVGFRADHLYYPRRGDIGIYVAGRGPAVLQVAGELADGVIIGGFTGGTAFEYALDRVAQGEAKRDAGLAPLKKVSWVYFAVGADPVRAGQAAKRGIAVALWGSRTVLDRIGLRLPASLVRFMDANSYSLSPQVIEQAMELVPDELVEDFSISGTPEHCARKLNRLHAAGIDQVAIWPFPGPGQTVDTVVETFVEQVIPLVGAREMAPPAGLEPATGRLEGGCSIRLS
jgi:5,10-methylenetetrahydromethanopterin reductase